MAAPMTDDAPSMAPAAAPTAAAAVAPAPAAAAAGPAVEVQQHSGPEDVLRRVVALTLVRLRELDAERGVSEHEAAQTAAKLQADLMAVMEARVREQRDAVHALSAAIDACVAAIREHAAALYEDAGLAQLAQIEQQQLQAPLPLRAKYDALSKLMTELAQKKQLRHNVIANFTAQSVAMARDLQEPLAAEYAAVGGDFSATRMAAVEQQHKALVAQHLERCDTAARAVADIMALWTELGVNTSVQSAGGLDAAIAAAGAVQPIDTSRLLRGANALSRDTMAALSARKQQLVDLRTQREQEAKAALVKIVDLYGRLNVPAPEREQFLAKVQSATFTPATMAIYATELARVEGLKSANAKQLVEQSRAHIQKLWKEMRVAEAEKKQLFPMCFDAVASGDAALSAHEQYLAALKKQTEEAAPLLKLIATREDSRAKLQEFHFNNANQEWRAEQLKGSKAFLWRKTEEEMHKLEKTALPKLDAKLQKMLTEWAAAHNGAAFRYDGEAYADCMARQAEDDRAAAEQRKIEEDERRAHKRAGAAGAGAGNPNLSTSMRMSDIGTVQAGLRPASAAGARPSLSANALMGTLAAVNAAVNGGVRASMYTPAKAAPASTMTPARGSILIKTGTKVLAPSTGAAVNKAPAAAAAATPSKAQRFGLPAAPLFDSPTKAAVSGVKLGVTTPAKAAAPTPAASAKKKTGAGKKRKSDEMLGTATPAKQPMSQEQIAAAQAAAQARANKAAAALKAKAEDEKKADDAAAAEAKQAAAAAAMAAAQARANKAAAALKAKAGAEKEEPAPKAEKEAKEPLSTEQQKAAAAAAMAAAQARANKAAAALKAKAAAAEEAPEKPTLSAEEAKAKAAAAMVAAQKRANKMAAKQKAEAEAAAAAAAEEEDKKQQPAAKKAKTGPSRAKSVDAKAKAKKKIADNKKAHATLKAPKAAAAAAEAAPAVAAAAPAVAATAAAAPAPMEAAPVAAAVEVAAALAAAAAAVDATPAPMSDDAPAAAVPAAASVAAAPIVAEATATNVTVDASVNASVALNASAVMNASVAAVAMADVSMVAGPVVPIASAPITAAAAAVAAADAVAEAAVADAAAVPAAAAVAAAPASPAKPKKTKKGKAKGKKKAKGKGKKAKAAAAAAAAASELMVLEDVTAADTGADAEEDKENTPAAAPSASAANVMAKPALTISVDKSAALASSSSSGALAPLSAGKRGAVTPPNAVAAALVIAGDDAHSFKAVLDGKKLVEAGQYTAALDVYTAGIGAAGSQAELCALYHARSTLYNHLKEYDRAIADSDRAMRADESAAVAIDAN